MSNPIRVALETGPKGKKVVAVALDWPGLSRGAATAEAAIERLRTYVLRYEPVAKLAGMEKAFDTDPAVDIVEQYPGTGSTDFWGISFAFSSIDQQAMSSDALERELTLLRACWAFFDGVRSRVSAELQKGPRGGGRDRDHIVRHIFGRPFGRLVNASRDATRWQKRVFSPWQGNAPRSVVLVSFQGTRASCAG